MHKTLVQTLCAVFCAMLVPMLEGGVVMRPLGMHMAMRKASGWTNPYITDGLVAMWDGEWNAGGGVHDANATVWKDLVGTHDMSPNTGYDAPAVGDDCFVFSTDLHNFVAMLDYNASNTSYLPMSIEVAYRTTKLTGNNLIISNWVGDRLGSNSARYWDSRLYGENFSNFEEVVGKGTLAFTRTAGTSGSLRVYFSAALKNEVSRWGLYVSPIQLGRAVGYSASSYYFVGDICAVRCYSHALTEEEIAYNYAIDKERFGL